MKNSLFLNGTRDVWNLAREAGLWWRRCPWWGGVTAFWNMRGSKVRKATKQQINKLPSWQLLTIIDWQVILLTSVLVGGHGAVSWDYDSDVLCTHQSVCSFVTNNVVAERCKYAVYNSALQILTKCSYILFMFRSLWYEQQSHLIHHKHYIIFPLLVSSDKKKKCQEQLCVVIWGHNDKKKKRIKFENTPTHSTCLLADIYSQTSVKIDSARVK